VIEQPITEELAITLKQKRFYWTRSQHDPM